MRALRKLWSPLISWEARLILASSLVLAVLYFFSISFLELMELKAWDLHFIERGKREPPSGLMAFVTIDEESVNRDGRWPWPRRQMARLLQAVEDYGARVIGLDMGFFEPDLKLRQGAILDLKDVLREDLPELADRGLTNTLEQIAAQEDDDIILANTIRRLTVPLVLGYFFYGLDSSFQPPTPPAEILDKAALPIVQIMDEPPPGRLREASGLETNLPIVLEATPYSGSFNVFADPDGSVRWMPLVIRYEDRYFPSLALQTLSAGLGLPPILKVEPAWRRGHPPGTRFHPNQQQRGDPGQLLRSRIYLSALLGHLPHPSRNP